MKNSWVNVSEERMEEVAAKWRSLRRSVLPPDWRQIAAPQQPGELANGGWFVSTDGLKVCAAVELFDYKMYEHISLSRRDRDPSYFDLKRVKDLFVGASRMAVMVFPEATKHYNYHPHCLHLFSPLEGCPLPDFLDESGQL